MPRLLKALIIFSFIAYPLWLHSAISKSESGGQQLLLVILPLLCGLTWGAFQTLRKIWWPFVALAVIFSVVYLVTGGHERIGLIALNGISHATLNLFLLWLFGRTLLAGREPLISRISRLSNGYLNPEVVSYTRKVTWAWSIYSAMQVLISGLLYMLAPIAAWSFFINVLNLPLLGLMFVTEITYRRYAYPNHPRVSILRAIEVYTKDLANSRNSNHM